MAKKENTVLAIDIGGSSLKMAEFSFPDAGGVVLEKFAFRDIEDREADPGSAFAEAYRAMIAEHGFKSKNVYLSISGNTSFSRLSKLPQLSGNVAAIARIIEFEAKQVVPYPMEEVVWGYQIISHFFKTQHSIESETPGEAPTVIEEENEEFEALFVAVKNEQITMYTDPITDSGKDIVSVDIAPVAMFNAAKASQCPGEESTLLLNIGGRCSSLVLSDNGRVFVRSIPIAGDTITQQISKEFGISFPEAEELKRRYGFVALGGAYEEPDSEVAATISKIARNIMTRLHGEINRSINVWRSQHGGNPPVKMLLAGGGSLMFYTQEFFHEKLRVPVDYLNVFSAISLGDGVDKQQLLDVAPMFPELIGMSLRGITSCPVDISLIPDSIKFQKSLQHKKPYFYISAAVVIFCLLVFLAAVLHRTGYSESLVEGTSGKVQETQKMRDQINGLKGQLSAAQGEYNEAIGFFRQRGTWIELMEELQQKTPDNMWFVSIEGQGTEIAPEKPAGPEDMMMADAGMGGMFGMPEDPAMSGAPAALDKPKLFMRKDASLISEVKELRVRFYVLVLDGEYASHELVEDAFTRALKESKFFVADGGYELQEYKSGRDPDNIKAFTAILKLKEPIKK
jgi:type IV pilus assembly protein PilM